MRKKLKIILFAPIFSVVAVVAALYWQNQKSIQESVRRLKHNVTKDFHDPESARFRAVRLQALEGTIAERISLVGVDTLWKSTADQLLSVVRYNPDLLQLCGEVNARNGFGAYVGYRRFCISGRDNAILVIDNHGDDFAERMCEVGDNSIIYVESDSGRE